MSTTYIRLDMEHICTLKVIKEGCCSTLATFAIFSSKNKSFNLGLICQNVVPILRLGIGMLDEFLCIIESFKWE